MLEEIGTGGRFWEYDHGNYDDDNFYDNYENGDDDDDDDDDDGDDGEDENICYDDFDDGNNSDDENWRL